MVCAINGDGRVRFGLREWLGIFGSMVVVAGLSSAASLALIRSHTDDKERHESALEKETRIYRVVDREMDHHIEEGPHAGVEVMFREVMDRLTRIETKMEMIHKE